MQFKELVAVLNNKTYKYCIRKKGGAGYMKAKLFFITPDLLEGKVIFITPDLLERKVKLVDVKRAFTNELFITMED